LRYCHFEKERLLIIRQEVQRLEDADAFNGLARDHSSRCSDFIYVESDMQSIRAEAIAKKKIEADAQQIAGWTWRSRETEGAQK
jgi:hypothetical protein